MNRFVILEVIAFTVLLTAPAVVIGGPAGPPEGLDVKIINPLPVPVEGNVTATIPETIDVNVVNTPIVTKQPYQEGFIDFYDQFSSSWKAESSQVPPGNRLTVEFLSLFYRLNEATEVNNCSVYVLSEPGCKENLSSKLLYTYYIPVSFAHVPSNSIVPYEVFTSMPILLYVEEGGSLCVFCPYPEGNTVGDYGRVTISGQMESVD
jgi:hypothetical protein